MALLRCLRGRVERPERFGRRERRLHGGARQAQAGQKSDRARKQAVFGRMAQSRPEHALSCRQQRGADGDDAASADEQRCGRNALSLLDDNKALHRIGASLTVRSRLAGYVLCFRACLPLSGRTALLARGAAHTPLKFRPAPTAATANRDTEIPLRLDLLLPLPPPLASSCYKLLATFAEPR